MMDATAIKADHPILDYARRQTALFRKGRDRAGGEEWAGPCPIPGCSADTDGFVVFSGEGRFLCRGCGNTGDVIALDQAIHGGSAGEAMRRLAGGGGAPPRAATYLRPVPRTPPVPRPLKARAHATPTLVDTTFFEDTTGARVLMKERYEPGYPDKDGRARDKSFKLYHPDPAAPTGWAWGRPEGVRALFNLKACLDTPDGGTIYFTEGELKAKALLAAGYTATCRWEGGHAWRKAYAAPFVGHHAVILEDADENGRLLTAKLLPDVQAVALSVKVVAFPECGEGADLLDWLAAGHTWAEFAQVVDAAPLFASSLPENPPPAPDPPPAPYRLLTAADLAALPPPSWLIAGLFETGKLAGLYGWYGGGKSFLALDWALCVAAGLPWFGRATQAGPVVYIAPEGVGGLYKRLAAWSAARGVAVPDTFRVLPDTVNMLDPATPAKLLDTLTAYALTPATLIVIDTLARSMPGGEENNQYFSLVVEHAGQIQRATGAAVLVVHHSGKNETAGFRGGTSFPAGADTVIGFRNDDGVITLKCEKQKDHEPFADSRWVLVPTGESCVIGPATDQPDEGEALSGRMRLVLEALVSPVLADGASARDLQDATGLAPGALFWCLNRLIAREYVGKSGRKGSVAVRYKAKADGYAALGQVAPWLAVLEATHTDSYESQPSLPPIPTPLTHTDSHADPAAVGVTHTDSHATHTRLTPTHTLPDPTHTHPTPPIRVGVYESGSESASQEEGTDPPAGDAIPPDWQPPPEDAPPRPAHVGFCGHGALAVAWDAGPPGRWRCRSCWAIRRE